MNKLVHTPVKPETRFISGAVWMISMRWAMRLIGLVSTMILARLLAPDDFGIIAMAMIVVALIDSLADTSVDLALIRHQSDTSSRYNAAWTIQILQGMLVASVLVVCAPYAVEYFHEARLRTAIHVLAISSLIFSFQNIGTVAFRKELDFAKEFRFSVYVKLSVFLFTVFLALVLRDYRAMVYSMLMRSVLQVVFSYGMHAYRPKISTRGMKDIWSFSQWLLISRIGDVVNSKASQFILGAAFGASSLGYYYMASELGALFVAEIVMPMRRAFFPNLSKLQLDHKLFSEAALKVVGVAAIAVFPVSIGLHLTAPEVVEVLLGERWLQASEVLAWISLFGAVTGIGLIFDLLLLVLGRAKLTSIKVWSETLILIPILMYTVSLGDMVLVAKVRFFVGFVFLPLLVIFAVRASGISWKEFQAVLWRPLLAAVVMYSVDVSVLNNLEAPAIIRLICHAGLGGLSYSVSLLLLWHFSGRPDSIEKSAIDALTARLT